MMKSLDRRGTSALEFALVGGPLFLLMFTIIDFGFYALTMHSLQALANAEQRACFINYNRPGTSIASCAGVDQLQSSDQKIVAPFLFAGGQTPSVQITTLTVNSKKFLQVQTTQQNFSTIFLFLGTLVPTPTVTTMAPYS